MSDQAHTTLSLDITQKLARRITYIDLSDDPRYMDHYTAALFLPHTDLDRFPSIVKDK